MEPKIIKGNLFSDARGTLSFNNEFNAAEIKRIYTIENANTDFVRAWQGHKIEQRWFAAVSGKFEIKLIQVDDWEKPSEKLIPFQFELEAGALDFLHVPSGYISSIRAVQQNSKLLVLADYVLGEVKDEYRFDKDYFEN